MAPRMQSDSPVLEGRTPTAGSANRQSQAKGGGTARQRCAFRARDQILSARWPVVLAPAADGIFRLGPDRDFAILPALPMQVNDAMVDVFGTHLQDFGDTATGIEEQAEQQMVPPTGPGGQVDGCENGVDLLAVHESEQGPVGALDRNSEDALSHGKKLGNALAECEAHERSDCGQSGVARADAVPTHCLDVSEESQDHFRRKGFKIDLLGADVSVLRQVAQEQPETVSIGTDRMLADVALGAQMREEALNEDRECLGSHRDAAVLR